MSAPRKYSQELRERAIRLLQEAQKEDPERSLDAAVIRTGQGTGVGSDPLRGWTEQAAIDAGKRAGPTTSEAKQIKDLEAEVRKLKRTNEIPLAASWFFARELDPQLPWWFTSSTIIVTGSGSNQCAECSPSAE